MTATYAAEPNAYCRKGLQKWRARQKAGRPSTPFGPIELIEWHRIRQPRRTDASLDATTQPHNLTQCTISDHRSIACRNRAYQLGIQRDRRTKAAMPGTAAELAILGVTPQADVGVKRE